jgi:hypothetical protein
MNHWIVGIVSVASRLIRIIPDSNVITAGNHVLHAQVILQQKFKKRGKTGITIINVIINGL